MKINGLWVGACTHPGPYGDQGYNAQRWLSPQHASIDEALPVQIVFAVPIEIAHETYDDLKDQLEPLP